MRSLLATCAAILLVLGCAECKAGFGDSPSSAATTGGPPSTQTTDKAKVPAKQDESAPKAAASLANFLAETAAMRAGEEISEKIRDDCTLTQPCFIGSLDQLMDAADVGRGLELQFGALKQNLDDGLKALANVQPCTSGSEGKALTNLLEKEVVADTSATKAGQLVHFNGWLSGLATTTEAVASILKPLTPDVNFGTSSQGAVALDDLSDAVLAGTKPGTGYTIESLRFGSTALNEEDEIRKKVSDVGREIDSREQQVPESCTVTKRALADARANLEKATKLVNDSLNGTGHESTLSTVNSALIANRLVRRNVQVVDLSITSNAVSTGDYKRWFTSKHLLMQSTLQVRYRQFVYSSTALAAHSPLVAQTNGPDSGLTMRRVGILAVICQSQASASDVAWYSRGFSHHTSVGDQAGKTENCAVDGVAGPR